MDCQTEMPEERQPCKAASGPSGLQLNVWSIRSLPFKALQAFQATSAFTGWPWDPESLIALIEAIGLCRPGMEFEVI
jgi:hypothetical protein